MGNIFTALDYKLLIKIVRFKIYHIFQWLFTQQNSDILTKKQKQNHNLLSRSSYRFSCRIYSIPYYFHIKNKPRVFI